MRSEFSLSFAFSSFSGASEFSEISEFSEFSEFSTFSTFSTRWAKGQSQIREDSHFLFLLA